MTSTDSFRSAATLEIGGRTIAIHRLDALSRDGVGHVETLPFSIKVLLENLLRHEDGKTVTREDIEAVAAWDPKAKPATEIAFRPARVLLQDFTGVPAVVDLAAMREAFARMGGDPTRINPLQPADLVIDHSVQVDYYGTARSFSQNVEREFDRNRERYQFLKWGQRAFENMRVVPPGTGIVHQVNLEYLARVAFTRQEDGRTVAYPDTLVGTDSHTTMINGLGVLGWGVGGIEAEAAMLGQPISMLLPQVVGFKLTGRLREGATATDVVLTVTQMLRAKGVVGKFVEFHGEGLASLSLPDRATIANMAPEYGATMGFFPVDAETLDYLRFTGRDEAHLELTERYLKEQGLFHTKESPEPRFTDALELDLGEVVPSLAGPKRPQDRIALTDAKRSWSRTLEGLSAQGGSSGPVPVERNGERFDLEDGAVVIAAITSCTNTSNPAVMLAAGIVAQKARARGLNVKPWVKTSLAPGSQVVTEYLTKAKLLPDLDALGFNLVGYGCTTCIGNSGPLDPEIAQAVTQGNLSVASVLSGNRNFEGRINPLTRANYLASPPLVVAYALAGTMDIDFESDIPSPTMPTARRCSCATCGPPTRRSPTPSAPPCARSSSRSATPTCSRGPTSGAPWRSPRAPPSPGIRPPPTSAGPPSSTPWRRARRSRPGTSPRRRVLCLLGDSVTTDHISPAGAIAPDSPAARYLVAHGVDRKRLQQLRKPPGQPRGHGAWHLRQHPPPEPARPRHRRWLDASPPRR
jgi:aconitate hydratase